MPHPPLKFLHSDESLSKIKLSQMEHMTTEDITRTLIPGQTDCLKTRPDGTLLDGHHRIRILQARGVDIDSLPREIIVKSEA